MKSYIKRTRVLFVFLAILTAFLTVFYLFKSLKSSLFFQKKDRINLVLYDKYPKIYSIGSKDNDNYYFTFWPDLEVLVPGGYGYYRTGALGKLVSLEKKPEIITRTFSLNTSILIDFYFLNPRSEVFYGAAKNDKFSLPNLRQIFFEHSNANIFNKLYLYFALSDKSNQKFQKIDALPTEKKGNELVFSKGAFSKKYQGFFYQTTYRNERKSVQIIYTKDINSAYYVEQMIEGEGIRVVDLAGSGKLNDSCQVIETQNKFSESAKALADFFHCSLSKGKTGISDIILRLGEREKDWLVK